MEENKKYTVEEAYEEITREVEKTKPNSRWIDVEQSKKYLMSLLNYQERYQHGLTEKKCEMIIKYFWQSFLDNGEIFIDVCDELGIQNKIEAMAFLRLRGVTNEYETLKYRLRKYLKLGGE